MNNAIDTTKPVEISERPRNYKAIQYLDNYSEVISFVGGVDKCNIIDGRLNIKSNEHHNNTIIVDKGEWIVDEDHDNFSCYSNDSFVKYFMINKNI